MKIRKAKEEDFNRIMKIYEHAREFMEATGNPNQWGPDKWPPESLIHQDIKSEKLYACVNDEDFVIGVFFYDYGTDIEPTYKKIFGGSWLKSGPYGVVHRIASDSSERGIGSFCLNWAFSQSSHLRIDTHEDNKVMQACLLKNNFVHCGTIFLEKDNSPRLAFEKLQ